MKYLALLLLLLAGFVACRKEQPKMNTAQNACACAEETSADFKIFELSGIFEPNLKTETDTAYFKRNVRFEAQQTGNEYQWLIGSEVLTEQNVGRYFSENFGDQTIPITLIVKREVNKICFPMDDGRDTVTKTIHFVSYIDPPLSSDIYNLPWHMDGSYKFKNVLSPTSDSFIVDVDMYADGPQIRGIKLTNLFGIGDSSVYKGPFQYNYRGYLFRNGVIKGELIQELNGRVRFEFKDQTTEPKINYQYIGRKLN